MNKFPFVSVIIPVFNGQSTLTECLYSLLNQSYSHYEVIVVDNASTDATKRIILNFKKENPKIRYAYEPFLSRGACRNRGIQEAKGSIIAMTDSDCIVPQTWLEHLTKPIITNHECVVVGNEEDELKNFWTRMQQNSNQEFLKSHTYGQTYIDHIDTKNFAIRKQDLERAGLFNQSIKNLEDFELKIRLKKSGCRIYFLESLKVKHRHCSRCSLLFHKRIDQGFWAARIYILHKDSFKKHPEELMKSMKFLNFITFFPWLFFFASKNSWNKTFYEFICGMGWRIGIIKAFLDDTFKKNFRYVTSYNARLS